MVQHALPHLRTAKGAGGGRIVWVSSGAATKASSGWAPYCTSKAAVNMLVAGLGMEEKEVTSVSVRPGMGVFLFQRHASRRMVRFTSLIVSGVVDTDMQALLREKGESVMDKDAYARFSTMKKEGRLLPPALPGTAIAKLALGAPREMSGEFVNWDDGRIDNLKI